MLEGESHGRLGMSAILHGLDPAVVLASQIGLVLSFVTTVLVLIDLVRRGRMRKTSLAFTGLLTCLTPVIAVYAVAHAAIDRSLMATADTGPLSDFVIVQGAVAFLQAALFSGLGVVLTFLLRLDDAWRGREPARSREPKPRRAAPE